MRFASIVVSILIDRRSSQLGTEQPHRGGGQSTDRTRGESLRDRMALGSGWICKARQMAEWPLFAKRLIRHCHRALRS